MSVDSTDELMDILPCVSCGVNADPADGFGKCTCGNEAKRAALQSLIEDARKQELEWFKQEPMKYFRKELSEFRKEIKNSKGLDAGEIQVLTMLLNRIDARYNVMRFMRKERLAQLSNSKDSK